MVVEFRLLGDVEARSEGQRLDIGPTRQRCVLVALLVDVNHPVSADQLIDRIWADTLPHRARNALAGYLSRLRQVITNAGGVEIAREPGGYVLKADPTSIDVNRFRQLTSQARAATDPVGPEERAWVERMLPDYDNLRAAFEHVMADSDVDTALRLVTSLAEFVHLRIGYESSGWAERVLELADPDHPRYVAAIGFAARGAWNRGDFARAEALAALARTRARPRNRTCRLPRRRARRRHSLQRRCGNGFGAL